MITGLIRIMTTKGKRGKAAASRNPGDGQHAVVNSAGELNGGVFPAGTNVDGAHIPDVIGP